MSPRHRLNAATLPVGLLVGLLAPSLGMGQSLPLPADRICIPNPGGAGRIIAKDRLVDYLLERYPFNARAIPRGAPPAALAGLSVPSRIVADPGICTGNASCNATDRASVGGHEGALGLLLSGVYSSFRPTSPGIDAATYLAGADERNAVRCPDGSGTGPTASAPTNPAASIPGTLLENLRIRGKVDDLYVSRTSPAAFRAVSQARASLDANGVEGRTTSTFTGVIGYNVPVRIAPGVGEFVNLVPYFRFNRVFTDYRAGSSSKDSATETFGFGLLSTLYGVTEAIVPIGHVINLRPDYLTDTQDGSRIASLNLQYAPIIDGVLNSYRPLLPDTASVQLLADLRAASGSYLDRGNDQVRQGHQDFLRLGGRVGISLVSDMPQMPVEMMSTYTALQDQRGGRDVGYFSNDVTWALDANKYFLIGLSYANGTREDTTRREQTWQLGLRVRY